MTILSNIRTLVSNIYRKNLPQKNWVKNQVSSKITKIQKKKKKKKKKKDFTSV